MLRSILIVGLGGFAGSVLRYLAARFLNTNFPWGTMLVNIAGCLLVGIFYGMIERGDIASPEVRLLLTVGFCGGFTTFSAFMNENFMMLKAGEFLPLAFYTAGSLVLGLIATWFGYWLVRAA